MDAFAHWALLTSRRCANAGSTDRRIAHNPRYVRLAPAEPSSEERGDLATEQG